MAPVKKRVLPGFGLSLGVTVSYLTLLLLLPLAALVLKASGQDAAALWAAVSSDEAVASYVVTFKAALAASLVNAVMGTLLAWILVRYRFPTRGFWNAIVDLPMALPGAVGGIALATVFASHGWLGSWLEPLGLKVAYAEAGITVAIVFTGLPFVVRSVQPVLEGLDPAQEEAARLLGAQPRAVFWRVILPALMPSIVTGFTMAFARGVGEFGTVIFVTSNIPLKTEVVSRHIANLLEQYNLAGATAVGAVTLGASFALLLAINAAQAWQRRHERRS
jgi:sulfate transport system permease protein